MISAILILIAAASNAMMDTLVHHWYKFKWLDKVNKQWWNPAISWRNKYTSKFPVQLTDAWHLFKTIMLFCMIGAVVVYKPIIHPLLDFGILGLVWIGTFKVFYEKIFVK